MSDPVVPDDVPFFHGQQGSVLPIPDFLEERLKAFEEESITPRRNGKPLVLGKKPGTRSYYSPEQ